MLLVQLVLRYLLFITIHGGLLYFNPHDFKETSMDKPTLHTQAPASKKTPRDPFKQNNPSSLDYLELPVYGPLEPFDSLPVSQDEPFNLTLRYPAHKPLWKWSRRDFFRTFNACEHVSIVGETGSSKTSVSLVQIVQAYAEAGFGGLLQGPKANFAQTMERALSKAGALNRSMRLCYEHGKTYGGINLVRATGGNQMGKEENVIDLIFAGSEVVTRTMGVGQGDPFWIIAARSAGKKLVALDQADNGSVDVRRLLALCESIPRSPEALGNDWNDNPALAACLRVRAKYPEGANYTIDAAIRYVTVVAPNVGEKALGSILATLTAYLEPWCDEFVYNAVCKDSGTWKLSDLREKGLIVINDYPLLAGWEQIGAVIGASLKRAVQRQLESELKGSPSSHVRPVMIVLDDAGHYLNSDDVKFLQTAREPKSAVVIAWHSLAVLRDQFGGTDAGLNKVKALLSFFMTTIAHQLSDEETSKFLSGKSGQHWVARTGGGSGESSKDGKDTQRSENTNYQYVLEPTIPYHAFARLKRGGERNGGKAQMIVMSVEGFKANKNYSYMKVCGVQEPICYADDDRAKSFREWRNRWWHRWNDFKGRSMFIWTDLTPRLRIWNGHVPFYKVAGWLFLNPERGKKLLERWIYFWMDEREIAVYEEARDESRH
jgi:hypothetical protein